LATRSKLWTPEDFRESVANTTADMDFQSGRNWRPLADTSRAIQFTYAGARQWRNERRGADYYYEGMLIWLDADVLIRQKSGGKLSLDDFCRKFHGGQNTGAVVKPYDLNEVLATLNSVVPYDWRAFFNERVYSIAPRAPMGGLTGGGWKLTYTDQPNSSVLAAETLHNYAGYFYSLGLTLSGSGEVRDVIPGTAAAKAGMTPGMSITTVNGEKYSAAGLRKAIDAAKGNSSSIVLVVDDSGFEDRVTIDYHDGNRYPHLVRDESKADLLTEVIRSK
jgi:predicted metalloprotease with PDZ domain